MSDQIIEEKIETEFVPNADGDLKPQTSEEKFFGVKTEINATSSEDDLKVEVVDDTPEEDRRPAKQETEEVPVDDDSIDAEITEYSKRAGDRINKIKYEYHEERRAKEAAERQIQEATTRLQGLMTENQKLQAMVSQGGEVLNKQAHNNALWAKQNAQVKYKKAYEEGDADAMALAQEEISKAVLAEQSAGRYAESVQSQFAQNYQAQEPQVQPVQEQQLDPDMQAWSSKNPWFMNNNNEDHAEMTSYAITIDQRLRRNGILPEKDSEKYYAEVDKAMRNEYPQFFGVQPSVDIEEENQTKQPSNVVAPASRSTGGKTNPRSIRLTQTQVKLARQLGISPEQYAKQLLKET
tara:strand:+ start:1472 stop:2524 length:1053 start_codon:yes stop_codon:yes gene_type:complete